jgi:membrane-associated PAP2 superfamily phosphatase
MIRSAAARPLALTLFALALLLVWDASGLDLALARLAGTPTGFPWRDDAFLVNVMHEGAKWLSWLLVVGLFAALRWPVGVLRRLSRGERTQLALTALAGVTVISVFKYTSKTSCPWDLQVFGGTAQHVSHWAWGLRDGGPGKCFPAGHASAAFAYLGGYFVFRRHSSVVARAWFACAMVAGLALGLTQQLRGAHYMSHTLWTAWLCWVTGFAIDSLVQARTSRRGLPPALLNLNES